MAEVLTARRSTSSGERPAKRARIGETKAYDTSHVVRAIEELDRKQEALEQEAENQAQEVLAIAQKYLAIKRPLFEERKAIIARIPDFWKVVLETHEVFSTLLTDFDRAILSSLDAVDVADKPDIQSGYSVHMSFKPNNYFTNARLSKEFSYADGGDLKVIPSTIQWRDPSYPAQHDNAFFVAWYRKDDQEAEIGELFRDEFWPNPLQLYMAAVAESETTPFSSQTKDTGATMETQPTQTGDTQIDDAV